MTFLHTTTSTTTTMVSTTSTMATTVCYVVSVVVSFLNVVFGQMGAGSGDSTWTFGENFIKHRN